MCIKERLSTVLTLARAPPKNEGKKEKQQRLMRIRRVVSHVIRPVPSPPEASRSTSNPPSDPPLSLLLLRCILCLVFVILFKLFIAWQSLSHAGCVITTSGVFSFFFFFIMPIWLPPFWLTKWMGFLFCLLLGCDVGLLLVCVWREGLLAGLHVGAAWIYVHTFCLPLNCMSRSSCGDCSPSRSMGLLALRNLYI